MTEKTKAYKALAAAVVLQAVKDYRHDVWLAMNRQDKDAVKDMKKLEKFFGSQWCFELCGLKGDVMIEKIRKECRYDSKRIPDAGE